MLTVTALISDRVQANHAVQKLRARGVPADHLHTLTRDVDTARRWAEQGAGDRTAPVVTGALLGLLLGGALGWMLGGSVDPLAELTSRTLTGSGATALVGLGLGLALGLLLGLLASTIGQRRHLAAYVDGVAAGDTLLIVALPDEQLRDTELLLGSYGARAVQVLSEVDEDLAVRAPDDASPISPAAP